MGSKDPGKIALFMCLSLLLFSGHMEHPYHHFSI